MKTLQCLLILSEYLLVEKVFPILHADYINICNYYFNILHCRVSAIPHGPSARFLVENGKCVEGL